MTGPVRQGKGRGRRPAAIARAGTLKQMPNLSTLCDRLAQHDPTLIDVDVPPPPPPTDQDDDDEGDVDLYPLLAKSLADNGIVRSISIHGRGPCDDDGVASLAKSLPTMASLRSLTLDGVGLSVDDVDAIAAVLPSISKLEKLDLRSNGLDDLGMKSLSSVFCRCGNLCTIELTGNNVSDAGALALAEILPDLRDRLVGLSLGGLIGKGGSRGLAGAVSSLECLGKLDLSGNNRNGADLANALAASPLPSSLTCLKLGYTGIGPRGTKTLLTALAKNTHLRELDMGGCRIGFFGTKAIGSVGLPLRLEILDISRNAIGDDGAWQLSSSLATLKNLIALNLSSNQLGDDAAAEIGRLIPSLACLSSLDLSGNKDIGDSGAEVIFEAVLSAPSLRTLSLASNSIGDIGAAALGRALAGSCQLERLLLGSNNIGDDGATGLAAGIRSNKHLAHLILKSNKIGDEGAGEFVEHLDENQTLLTLDLSGNPVSSSRMVILDMLLKHRKPAATTTPATPDNSKDEIAIISTPSSPTTPATDTSGVHQLIDADTIEECRALVEHAIEGRAAPTSMGLSSQFAAFCTADFNPRNHLDYGAFGDLFEGTDTKTARKYAIRRITLGDAGLLGDMRIRVLEDLASLKQVCQPNVMSLLATSEDVRNTQYTYCMIYDLESRTPLNGFIADEEKRRQMTWPVRIKILKDIVAAVEFLHSGGRGTQKKFRPCYHGDIKSSNIFVEDGVFSAKIIDCGLSRLVATDRSLFQRGDVVFGTRGYRCPRYERGRKYTAQCDVFSLGVVIAEIIGGKLQNHVDDSTGKVHDFYYQYLLEKKITLDPLGGAIAKNAAGALCKLSFQCMNSEPSRRPSSSALVEILERFESGWSTSKP